MPSLKAKANVWVRPLPEAGVTETAAGGPLAAGMVQAPRCCQPVEPDALAAWRYKFFAPANDGWKANERFRVRTVPEEVTPEPAPFNVHWLFCWLPLPGVMAPEGAAPASVASARVLAARL